MAQHNPTGGGPPEPPENKTPWYAAANVGGDGFRRTAQRGRFVRRSDLHTTGVPRSHYVCLTF
jgi:hypothetical protein